jgi:hypothetical protein
MQLPETIKKQAILSHAHSMSIAIFYRLLTLTSPVQSLQHVCQEKYDDVSLA